MSLLALAAAIALYVSEVDRSSPDISALTGYRPPIVTTVEDGNGTRIAEYASERRAPIPLEDIPVHVREAFLAAEDGDFENHGGVDYLAIARAIAHNTLKLGSGERAIGGSTITQQVVKNVLVGSDRTLERKVAEAILAWKTEAALNKDAILEIYLNEVYFGLGAYGIEAAAQRYFGKHAKHLDTVEAAYLAALPKAPSNYHPIEQTERALERRNWVLSRMEERGSITDVQSEELANRPLAVSLTEFATFRGTYFESEVRRRLIDRYGQEAVYGDGLQVATSLDPDLQRIAQKTLLDGLSAYDRKQGWRGAFASIDTSDSGWASDWAGHLAAVDAPADLIGWEIAAVLALTGEHAEIGLLAAQEGETAERTILPLSGMKWAREARTRGLGPSVRAPRDVLEVGDVIFVERDEDGTFALRQIPEVGGGLVAMDPHTGRVLALAGGASFENSQFNRATQAMRQPGSAFKPIVYAAALEYGYSPNSVIVDAPISIPLPDGTGVWTPKNYSGKFYGPQTLARGLQFSRNVMTVRLASELGFETVGDFAHRFGVFDRDRKEPSLALGAGETTLLKMAGAYAAFANGGFAIEPRVIDTVHDRDGVLMLEVDQSDLSSREQVVSTATALRMTSLLQNVVQAGTGTAARSLGRPVAGKTGTTNDHRDAWFMGFTPSLVAGVYIGFDNPKPLGAGQTGGKLAAPIFAAFMEEAMQGKPVEDFAAPPEIPVLLSAELPIDAPDYPESRVFRLFPTVGSGQVRFPRSGGSLFGGGSGFAAPKPTGPVVNKRSPSGKSYSYQEGSKVGTYTINGRTFTYERD